jgi:hypothetical protein
MLASSRMGKSVADAIQDGAAANRSWWADSMVDCYVPDESFDSVMFTSGAWQVPEPNADIYSVELVIQREA